MREIRLSDLREGMVLAQDVEGDQFRILGGGTVLTDGRIDLLRAWKCESVFIEDEPADAPRPDPATEASRRELSDAFKGSLSNICMKTLYIEADSRLETDYFWRNPLLPGGPSHDQRTRTGDSRRV